MSDLWFVLITVFFYWVGIMIGESMCDTTWKRKILIAYLASKDKKEFLDKLLPDKKEN